MRTAICGLAWFAIAGFPAVSSLRAQVPATEQGEPKPGTPSAGRDGVRELIDNLTAAHRGGSAPAAIDAFAAQLVLIPERQGEDRLKAELEVRFQLKGMLIRYKADEGDKLLERGRDKKGPWARIDRELINLNKKEYSDDRNRLKQDIRLARQLVQFLDPGALARSLGESAVVADGKMPKIGTPVRTLSGTVDSFPLYATAGQQHRAHVKLYIDPESNRLIAVQATPVAKSGTPPTAAAGEFYHLLEHQTQDGLVLPTKVVLYQVVRGEPQVQAKVQLWQLDLAPKLTAAQFDRDQPWSTPAPR